MARDGPTDPLHDLDTLIRARTPVEVRELGTFWTGAVGFFAYDVVRLIERLPSPPKKAVPVRMRCSCSRTRS
jgi:anthranilate synthase component 1